MINLNPASPIPLKVATPSFNLLTINGRPYRVISGYFLYVLVCVMFSHSVYAIHGQASLTSGTYVATYFDDDYLVIGGDSRGTQLEQHSSADNVCKIIPLSNQVIFFALGITVGQGFNAREIARNVERSVGDDIKMKDIGDQWGIYMAQGFERVSGDHALTLIKHNNEFGDIVGGFFASMAGNNISLYKSDITISDQTAVPLKFTTHGEMVPVHRGISYFGKQAISREFTQNKTSRANAANEIMKTTPADGIDKWGIYIAAIVDFVERFSGDPKVGGPVTVMILDRKNGARWFRRPDFCPEN
jgi:hypothetical protein